MRDALNAAIAATAVIGAALLAGCPAPTSGTSSAQTGSPRDYLFPVSAGARYVYVETYTDAQPDGTTNTTTSTLSVHVIALAQYQATTVTTEEGRGYTATDSLTVNADDSVKDYVEAYDPPDPFFGSFTYVPADFTSAGGDLTDASGSAPTMRLSGMGAESVKVPAGTFDCLKVQEVEKTDGRVVYNWYAKGTGIIKSTGVSTQSVAGGVATESYQSVLQSLTK